MKKYLYPFLLVLAMIGCQQHTKKSTDTEKQQSTKTDSAAMPNKATVKMDTAKLIVPGERLGKIVLNHKFESLLQYIGEPDDGNAAMGKSMSIWYKKDSTAQQEYPPLYVVFSVTNMGNEPFARIKYVRTTATTYKTQKGIGVGSSLAEIKKHFTLNTMGTFTENGEHYRLETTTEGIAFEIGADKYCHGILIFPKDKLATQTYIPIYPTLKQLEK